MAPPRYRTPVELQGLRLEVLADLGGVGTTIDIIARLASTGRLGELTGDGAEAERSAGSIVAAAMSRLADLGRVISINSGARSRWGVPMYRLASPA